MTPNFSNLKNLKECFWVRKGVYFHEYQLLEKDIKIIFKYKQGDDLGICLCFCLHYLHLHRLIFLCQPKIRRFNLNRFWSNSEPLWREFAYAISDKLILFLFREVQFLTRSVLENGPQDSIYQKRDAKIE